MLCFSLEDIYSSSIIYIQVMKNNILNGKLHIKKLKPTPKWQLEDHIQTPKIFGRERSLHATIGAREGDQQTTFLRS
jgi:hypothetical protein